MGDIATFFSDYPIMYLFAGVAGIVTGTMLLRHFLSLKHQLREYLGVCAMDKKIDDVRKEKDEEIAAVRKEKDEAVAALETKIEAVREDNKKRDETFNQLFNSVKEEMRRALRDLKEDITGQMDRMFALLEKKK